MRVIMLVAMMFMGQFVMTPERKAAMDKAGVEIKTQQGKVDTLALAEKQYHEMGVKQASEKQKVILEWKKKLGLDATWTWDDKQNDWVQSGK